MFFFFFNDTATTEIYTLSLHDALPISAAITGTGHRSTRNAACSKITCCARHASSVIALRSLRSPPAQNADRKSTRLNSSHSQISYAVFCLKKKKQNKVNTVVSSEILII